ncbi:hypothetical protein [Nostoc sp.]|uniref:hypothetical protein n=1 Tax=Nostoc sp. TaxID=1180 RepID=UPI002FFB9B6A
MPCFDQIRQKKEKGKCDRCGFSLSIRNSFHPVQNICFTRGDRIPWIWINSEDVQDGFIDRGGLFKKGDRLCNCFAHNNQSTWKNFDSFGSEHKPIRSEHKPIRSEHKPIRSEHKPIRSEHESIRSEHESIRSEHESIRSEHKSIRSEHKSIRSEHKSIRSEHKFIRSEHKSLRHPRKISLVKGVH